MWHFSHFSHFSFLRALEGRDLLNLGSVREKVETVDDTPKGHGTNVLGVVVAGGGVLSGSMRSELR